ncbi:antirestriction protein ArdA [Hyphomonas jannaschiana]|uniref:Antirestriction protein n=1 Tax=Hyphomonas jannaschiana VP2 TaxID=1280952 RepID=A0A059FGS7_9PROT|nr:antirestriction protein ArdA [Hyphomonas jannaschiana]KCZ89741.1 antirestriction protein [Hyphomonas jannaschiana VP2]
MTDEIRIYVACLAAYNNGILHGAWIDAQQGVEAINADIQKMLRASPIEGAEEYAVHDYEGFEGLSLSEYEGIQQIVDKAEFIAEHGTLGAELANYFGDLESAQTALEDHYAGEFHSVSEFAEQITEETTEIPESLRFYIDYERMARDLEINDIIAIKLGFDCVHIFWSH